jgi:hypothetical protein
VAEARGKLATMLENVPAGLPLVDNGPARERQRRDRPESGQALASKRFASSPTMTWSAAAWWTKQLAPHRLRAAALKRQATLADAWAKAPHFIIRTLPAQMTRRAAAGKWGLFGGASTPVIRVGRGHVPTVNGFGGLGGR